MWLNETLHGILMSSGAILPQGFCHPPLAVYFNETRMEQVLETKVSWPVERGPCTLEAMHPGGLLMSIEFEKGFPLRDP